ncbi:MAG: hypothetical protein NkDv07_0296 [Candidatus Improbicoccus devescovinae]|nr:MAG: hypothetical protein NkDv07_0296 [Candidatus Improbicoccus devescovinae]
MRNKKNMTKILAIILLVVGFFCIGPSRLAASATDSSYAPPVEPLILLEADQEGVEFVGLSVKTTPVGMCECSVIIYSGELDEHMVGWIKVLYRNKTGDLGAIPIVYRKPILANGRHLFRQIGWLQGAEGQPPRVIVRYVKNSFALLGDPRPLMVYVWWFDQNCVLHSVSDVDTLMPNTKLLPVIVVSPTLN